MTPKYLQEHITLKTGPQFILLEPFSQVMVAFRLIMQDREVLEHAI